MNKTIKNFTDALQRLIEGTPKIIQGKYSINNDTVALEAGRKRGTIKKSRPELANLIIDIEKAEAARTGKIFDPDTSRLIDIKLQKALDKIVELEANLLDIKDKYQQQKIQLVQQIYINSELKRKLKNKEKSENSLLDFINN